MTKKLHIPKDWRQNLPFFLYILVWEQSSFMVWEKD